MVTVGDTVSDFVVPGTPGDEIEPYRLSEYTDTGAVVLVFYPFDFSPVCTEVLCSFRDAEWLTFSEGVDVFGVSRDACYAHQRFIDEYDIQFPLLSDTTGRVTDQLDLSYDELEHHEDVPKRALLTIDDTSTVRYKWATEDPYESPSIDDLEGTVTTLLEEGS